MGDENENSYRKKKHPLVTSLVIDKRGFLSAFLLAGWFHAVIILLSSQFLTQHRGAAITAHGGILIVQHDFVSKPR